MSNLHARTAIVVVGIGLVYLLGGALPPWGIIASTGYPLLVDMALLAQRAHLEPGDVGLSFLHFVYAAVCVSCAKADR